MVASLVVAKRAVIFDLFHTLTSVESISGRGLRSTSELLGVDRVAWSDQLNEKSDERLLGLKTDPFEIIAGMARAIDPSLSDERIRLAVENRLARFRSAVLDIPGETVGVLWELKARGKRLGLISNADVVEIAAWHENCIHHLFDSTVFSCTVGLMKPNRKIYELSLRELDVAAFEAAFVGDGGSHELVGAKEARITAVMFAGVIRTLWPERVIERAGQADYVIENLAELVAD
jgi:putative hydrolase of the HAD superfamily